MLKRPAVLAATLAAVAISLVGVPQAWAANPGHPSQGPSAQPAATPSPGPSSSTGHEEMPGMDHDQMAGMDHEQTSEADQMAGMSEQEMAGMNHEEGAKPSPSQPASEEGASHSHTGTEATSTTRPLAAVVSGFAAINGAVLVAAGLMRRRDKRLVANPPTPSGSAK